MGCRGLNLDLFACLRYSPPDALTLLPAPPPLTALSLKTNHDNAVHGGRGHYRQWTHTHHRERQRDKEREAHKLREAEVVRARAVQRDLEDTDDEEGTPPWARRPYRGS